MNPLVLRGIAAHESNNNPKAVHRNKNGTVDYGMMQINSVNLKELNKYGIHRRDLMDECKSIYAGAFLLKQKMVKHGNTTTAIGAYHSESPKERRRYAKLIQKQVEKIEATQMMASND
ncbi:lytic transglycosylase domain-containing protein [Paraburkholderia sp. BR10936]|uniref:lytic transglycosylase domain-containing protein n=1 Tax=Paraburkholderia sp. BR10936 TaxID=3236993 RepID=UPI0034D175E1